MAPVEFNISFIYYCCCCVFSVGCSCYFSSSFFVIRKQHIYIQDRARSSTFGGITFHAFHERRRQTRAKYIKNKTNSSKGKEKKRDTIECFSIQKQQQKEKMNKFLFFGREWNNFFTVSIKTTSHRNSAFFFFVIFFYFFRGGRNLNNENT